MTVTISGTTGISLVSTDSVPTAAIQNGAVTIAKLAATGTPSSSTYLRGDNTWASASGGVTSVATGNGLTGGTITSTGTLSIAAPTFNTVGSYVYGYMQINGITSGSNYSAGSGSGTVAAFVATYPCGSPGGGSFVNSLSGTWKWMGATQAFNASWVGIFCRVA